MTAVSSTFKASSGEGYELVMGRWSRQIAGPFLDFVGATDGERVLDVGCGTGNLALAVAERCPRSNVVGIDFAQAYVAYASARMHDPRLSFAVGDVCALEFPERSFDRALCLLVLHFVPDTVKAVSEMRRVVKPGGVIAAAVWDARGGFVANRLFFDTAAALDPKANERRAKNYTRPMTRPGELGHAWRVAGLTDVVETTVAMRMTFASFDDYWAPYAGTEGPAAEYVATLSDADRSRLRDAVRRAYLDGDPDGERSYLANAWVVKGVVA